MLRAKPDQREIDSARSRITTIWWTAGGVIWKTRTLAALADGPLALPAGVHGHGPDRRHDELQRKDRESGRAAAWLTSRIASKRRTNTNPPLITQPRACRGLPVRFRMRSLNSPTAVLPATPAKNAPAEKIVDFLGSREASIHIKNRQM